ncbi:MULTISPECIES: hypothetical protein [Bacillus]|uniref:Phr family secreted Rap phosphatase inhibitor n=1 Tax=Bacillus thuringiensis YBT-1518 TaxID=529122 RepID=A0A9W3KM24_BACTU|nr:hypothetical protein [Bacillus thuringiensis]EKS8367027.1 hypothetical protein [Bacillus cereus]AHA75299.1 hypothetical protein YBT1518_34811 [Bacillus thuringiensis YBT-1518]EKS8373034.1 hypothetical protein [Bacillus cereus]MDM8365808.1 hypothetical protein [Bacillus thuringiensis]MED3391402.1 hypothetical protein [Bacillus thuringiensis]
MRKFSIIILSVASAFTILLNIGVPEKENVASKTKDIEYVQYMSREPGGL